MMPYRSSGHGPKSGRAAMEGTLMIDATLKHDMPPLALPTEEFMMRAKEIWQELDLPRITPQAPWHGYDMGDWDDAWTEFADAAVAGDWRKSGTSTYARRHGDLIPETPVRSVESPKKK